MKDETPAPGYYDPAYGDLFPQPAAFPFPESELNSKRLRLGRHCQGEMLAAWERNMRTIEFDREDRQILIPEPPVLRPLRPARKGSGECRRDGWIARSSGPGPGAGPVLPSPDHISAVPFALQSGRTEREPPAEPVLRDTGPAIDAVRASFPRPIPFDKQSGREKPLPRQDSLWDELNVERERMAASVVASQPGQSTCGETDSPERRPKTADFVRQSGRPQHPFVHCMPKWLEVEYETDKREQVRAFNIAQPGLRDRSEWLVRRGGPDAVYDARAGFAATIERPQSALLIGRSSATRDSYVTRSEGRGEPLVLPSTLVGIRVIDFALLAPRVFSLESKR